jgi:hypothetical protein
MSLPSKKIRQIGWTAWKCWNGRGKGKRDADNTMSTDELLKSKIIHVRDGQIVCQIALWYERRRTVPNAQWLTQPFEHRLSCRLLCPKKPQLSMCLQQTQYLHCGLGVVVVVEAERQERQRPSCLLPTWFEQQVETWRGKRSDVTRHIILQGPHRAARLAQRVGRLGQAQIQPALSKLNFFHDPAKRRFTTRFLRLFHRHPTRPSFCQQSRRP